jgi:hypothetical protein
MLVYARAQLKGYQMQQKAKPQAGQDKPTILGFLPIGLAAKEKARLFAGLEAFVNTGDTLDDYQAHVWWPKAHAMFLDYRNKLRNLWGGDDPEAQASGVLAYLLGIVGPTEFAGGEYVLDVDTQWFAREAIATLEAQKAVLPYEVWSSHSIVFPVLGQANFHYLPRGDFESALWALSCEGWRARMCGQCNRYFIADKPAQTYCGTGCYGDAKRGQKLEWWNRMGKIRRAQKGVKSAKRRKQ